MAVPTAARVRMVRGIAATKNNHQLLANTNDESLKSVKFMPKNVY